MSRLLRAGDKAPDFEFESPWASARGFYETIPDQAAVFVFLRYHGCPVCQMEMAALKNDIELFSRKKARVMVFLQSSAATLTPLLKKEDWPFDIVCDPKGKIFKRYGVEPGGILKYLHPAGLISAVKAVGKGFAHKKFEGRETQLPAAFIIPPDKIVKFAYYGSHIGDVPRPFALAEKLD